MAIAKRIFLFLVVNLLVTLTITIILGLLSAFGIQLIPGGGALNALAVWSLVWGMGGAFVSLLMSKFMAKMMMGVEVIPPDTSQPQLRDLVETVHGLARKAGLKRMPEVGIYESPEVNAFATGPSRNNSLVAVSTGLLQRLQGAQLEGVLGHEIAHIRNGDMVTMTLIQGVVNAFVLFFSRILTAIVGQYVYEKWRFAVEFMTSIVLQIAFGMLGSIVVCYFSRTREYRADAGGASLSSRDKMVSALRALASTQESVEPSQPAFATLKISDRSNWLSLFSTHPPLAERIRRLEMGYQAS